MISLICMSTHKAMAARCLSYHQAAYGQPAIRVLATAPLRRLALSVLFTIVTNSYQTTCTISERTFNKRQHANARYGVDFSLFTHYDNTYLYNIYTDKDMAHESQLNKYEGQTTRGFYQMMYHNQTSVGHLLGSNNHVLKHLHGLAYLQKKNARPNKPMDK